MTVDLVTYEVLRHRLWMINDEQANVAMQVSGSPVVYETKDLSSALMNPDGDGLFVSAHASRLALCTQYVAKTVIERFAGQPIRPGDAFITNDPWAGAIHQNDVAMVAPMFWQDTLVGWTGLVMHEMDVGGATPGGLSSGTADVFAEGPLIPPVKIVENWLLRPDLEAWAIRNSRTPLLNGLNLRGRLAACRRTQERFTQICARYGADALLAVQSEMIDRTREAIRKRIAALPDGAWRAETLLDHNGVDDIAYRVALTLSKQGERLIFDFEGTDPQAAGGINCTEIGLESGVVGSALTMLCYDLPWSTGALRPLLEVRSQPGTINNATHPAGVSHGTVAASRATAHVALAALSKLCALSSGGLASQVEANWTAGYQGMTLNGVDKEGEPFTGVTLDQPGGGGARIGSDGLDTGGVPGGPTFGTTNVETYEKIYPLLYLYRRQAVDSGGAGRFRGGVGTELVVTPHKLAAPLSVTVVSHGAKQPEAGGLFGGFPGSVQVRLLMTETSALEQFKAGATPNDISKEFVRSATRLPAKARLGLREGEALLFVRGGGGGVGDPLERPIPAVVADVQSGLVSKEIALTLYGVPVAGDAGTLDERTRHQRDLIRAGRGGASPGAAPGAGVEAFNLDGRSEITTAYAVEVSASATLIRCRGCGLQLAHSPADPKVCLEETKSPIALASPWNVYGDTEHVELRQYACPRCHRLAGVDARRVEDETLFDFSYVHE
ncbi:MAG: hypothetical protein JWO33_1575 [Caulobacteraceae bacterium]|nr:hypothetical protein [Caulobacteraceae bacterium]